MSLQDWLENNWLVTHITSKQEISGLFSIVQRNLDDVKKDISTDSKFGLAYNAALNLCTILLYAKGYKATRSQHHFRTIKTLPLILGDTKQQDAEYLNTCRIKRNILDYDYSGGITFLDAEELIDFVVSFKKEVVNWLSANYPEYL